MPDTEMTPRDRMDRMFAAADEAVVAILAKDNAQALVFLEQALGLGEKLLFSGDLDETEQILIALFMEKTIGMRNMVYMEQIPEEERSLVTECLQTWNNLNIVVVGGPDLAEQLAAMFTIAKSRLDDPTSVLRLLYDGSHVPTTLRKVMQGYMSGAVTREDTAAKLDEYAAVIKKHIEVLFPQKKQQA